MKISDSIKISFRAVAANKLRSGLTALGVIIGIASVIIMIALGEGAQNLIIGQIASMGSTTIFIEPGAFDPKKGGDIMQSAMEEMSLKTLTYDDALALEKDPLVEAVSAIVFGVDRIVYKNIDKKVSFMGGMPASREILDIHTIKGRDITNDDLKSNAKVAVLGYKLAQDLFGEENPIGETIRIKKTNFKVIGVLEEQGTQMFMNLDENIFIPLTTAQRMLLGTNSVNWILAKARSEEAVDETVESIRLVLRERHHLYNPEGDLSKDDFKVMSQKETARMVSTVTSVLTLFLALVAAIALLVGGIGIMNIMFVSVTERTREIGLRKAVGAKSKDILEQFLIEAVILTVLGGFLGIVSGIFLSFIGVLALQKIGGLEDWRFFVPYQTVVLAFGICVAVGLIFGIYPARKASRLDPIQALRYE